ncbi:hypothetical protein EOD39_13467 [Acipenser ruthenus]|uniref:Uncharacterized protein n=1 Tax=Acipenser ruthenus TaxID=7906 RepID=A0A662YNK6_ACIRT|nr:hypothetical protein EOD39_13467 [Acipenser ruthenus]
MAYHDQLKQIATAEEEITRLVEQRQKEMEAEDQTVLETEGLVSLVHFVPQLAAEVLGEFRDVAAQPVREDAEDMVNA